MTKKQNIKISIEDIEKIEYMIAAGLHLAYFDDNGDYIDLFYQDDNGKKQEVLYLEKIMEE